MDKDGVINFLSSLDQKKPLGTELFNAVARVSINVAIEAMAIKKEAGKFKIFMLQRGLEETFPGQWHFPGTILRPGDSIDEAFLRLEKNEFKTKVIDKRFVSFFNNPHGLVEERGHFLHLIYLCHIDRDGSWFDIDDLPENMVRCHKDDLIPLVVEYFKNHSDD